jgi:hypothetical protein
MLLSASCQPLSGWPGFGCSSVDHARVGKAGAVARDVAIWISLSKVAKVLERPVEAEYEWIGVVMTQDFNNKTVFMVAAIIGGVVLLLGLVGALA